MWRAVWAEISASRRRAKDGRRHTVLHTTDTYERLVKWQRFEFNSNREQPPRCFERLRHCDEIDFES